MAAMGGMSVVDLIMLLFTTSTYREYIGALLVGLLMGSAVYMNKRHSLSKNRTGKRSGVSRLGTIPHS